MSEQDKNRITEVYVVKETKGDHYFGACSTYELFATKERAKEFFAESVEKNKKELAESVEVLRGATIETNDRECFFEMRVVGYDIRYTVEMYRKEVNQ